MTALTVFVCQCVYVFLLGLQSRNVRDGQYAMAVMTSTALGCVGLVNQVLIIRATLLSDLWPLAAYVAAGPIGICLAMATHDRIKRWRVG
jgi:hypothetical protein